MDLINPSLLDTLNSSWIEQRAVGVFRIWHIMFISCAGLLTIVIMICCCVKIRIPRTKQEIEADYQRKKLTRKFQKQLKLIKNDEIDELDLKKALERIHKEMYETESDTQVHLSSSNNSVQLDNVSSSESHKITDGGTAESQQPALLNRTFSQKVSALVRLSKLKSLPPIDNDNIT